MYIIVVERLQTRGENKIEEEIELGVMKDVIKRVSEILSTYGPSIKRGLIGVHIHNSNCY